MKDSVNSASSDSPQASGRMFYGWAIVAIATFALVVSNGFAIGGIPIFYKFVQNDFVASGAVAADRIQSVYGLAPALTFLLSGFISPVGGYLLQRVRPRAMMAFGCIILGSGLLVYSRADSPLQVYVAHALLGTSLGFVGVIIIAVLISNWFVRRRGLALGVVLAGTSAGGVVVPQIALPLIERYGWRTAMALVSLVVWIVLLPTVVLFVKNRPDDVGVAADGCEGVGTEMFRNEAKGIRFEQALTMPIFWLLSACSALVFYAIFVVSQQLNLFLVSGQIGLSSREAATVQSLLFAFSIAGKFLFGWLADRFRPRRALVISSALMFASCLLLFRLNGDTAYYFAVVFGLTYGGTFVLLQLLVAEVFGAKEYGKILGAIFVVETVGGALGTLISGKIADASGGDFTYAFYLVFAAAALALVAVAILNLWPRALALSNLPALPLVLVPVVFALAALIAAPLVSEIVKVVFGIDRSLTLPLVGAAAASGGYIGFFAGRNASA